MRIFYRFYLTAHVCWPSQRQQTGSMLFIALLVIFGGSAFATYTPTIDFDNSDKIETIAIDPTTCSDPADMNTCTPAVQEVISGGITKNVTIANLGVQNLRVGGTANGTRINNGGIQNVYAGATVTGTLIYGGTQNITGGSVSDTSVYGIQNLNAGSASSLSGATNVYFGGEQNVNADGVLNLNIGCKLNNDGECIAQNGTKICDADDEDCKRNGVDNWSRIIINSGGTQNINNGVTISMEEAARINLNGGKQVINSGGTVNGMNVASTNPFVGATQEITSGGHANDTTIGQNGRQIWNAGAVMGGNNTVGIGGEMIFNGAANTTGATIRLEGAIALGGETLPIDPLDPNAGTTYIPFTNLTVDANMAASTGRGGTIIARLRSGANGGLASDRWQLNNLYCADQSIGCTINVSLSLGSIEDIDALNALRHIDDLITGNFGTGISFADTGAGLDIGIWNWSIFTDQVTGNVGAIRTASPSYLAISMVNHSYAVKNMVSMLSNSMHTRVGELQWRDYDDATQASSSSKSNGLWLRGIYRQMQFNRNVRTTGDITGMEFGYDHKLENGHDSKRYVGILGYQAKTDMKYKSMGPQDDLGALSATGVGAYGIWLGEDGQWFDLVGRMHFISQTVEAWAAGNTDSTNFDTSHWALSLNFEHGVEYISTDTPWDTRSKYAWVLTPRISGQIAYISGSGFEDEASGFTGRLNSSTNIAINAGAMYGPRWTFSGGSRLKLYGKAGLQADFSQNSRATFKGLTVGEAFNPSALEVGLGANYRSPRGYSMLYFDILDRIGFDYNEFSAIGGLRVEF